MNNINELLKELDAAEEKIRKQRTAILELQPRIEGFKHNLQLSFGYLGTVDIDYPGREMVVNLITFMKAGKWDKALSNQEGKIDYVNKHLLSMPLRIYGAEPPPSCKIEEVPEEVPAQPARIVMRKKIVCKNGVSPVAV